jgi:hypothetical protein
MHLCIMPYQSDKISLSVWEMYILYASPNVAMAVLPRLNVALIVHILTCILVHLSSHGLHSTGSVKPIEAQSLQFGTPAKNSCLGTNYCIGKVPGTGSISMQ